MEPATLTNHGYWTVTKTAAEAGVCEEVVRRWARGKSFNCRRYPTGRLRGGRCIEGASFLRWLDGGENQNKKGGAKCQAKK